MHSSGMVRGESVVSRKCIVLASILVAVSSVGAQEAEESPAPYRSVKEATGEAFVPEVLSKHGGGGGKCQPADGEPHWWWPSGVVIAQANTDSSGNTLCTVPAEEIVVETSMGDLLFWRSPLHRLVFKPKSWRARYLEIIWSGQINVFSGFTPPAPRQYQTAFLECTVSYKGCTAPCSGTDWIPAIAQDLTTNGLSDMVTYHGYAGISPGQEVTVELWLWSWPFDGLKGQVNACGDTITLKY